MDQSWLGAVNKLDNALLSHPTPGTPRPGARLMLGKYAARATPMRAFAAAIARSAEATSGRRCNRSEGSPTGNTGNGGAAAEGARVKLGAGVPIRVAIACSNCGR